MSESKLEIVEEKNSDGSDVPSTKEADNTTIDAATPLTTTETDNKSSTSPAVPIKQEVTRMYGTEAALEEITRQEFEAQRALANVERAIQMQRQLSNAYGWDAETARVLATLEQQRNVQAMRMKTLAIQRQRVLTTPSATSMGGARYGTRTALNTMNTMGSSSTMGMNNSMGLGSTMNNNNTMSTMGTMGTMGSMGSMGSMGAMNNTMRTMNNTMNNTMGSMNNSNAMGMGGAFGATMKIQRLKQMEMEQRNTARMRQQLMVREQQLQRNRQQLMLALQKEALQNQQRSMQMDMQIRMFQQQEMMAKQQHQRTAAMLQQVQQQAYQAQQNAQMTQFKAQAMKQQQMFAKQAAAATASYAPNMNSSMNGSMGMMGGNRWNKLRANGTATNRSQAMMGRISGMNGSMGMTGMNGSAMMSGSGMIGMGNTMGGMGTMNTNTMY